MPLTIRPVHPDDHADWARLYAGYAAFYGVEQTEAMRATVWDWLHDPAAEVCGYVAERDGALIGLTHFRPFRSPLRAVTNCFLDDLFVDPAARGSGAARALIEAVEGRARDNGWKTVRWITADDNYRARGLYDQMATRTHWITYDIPL
ncbi:GNAT family N-acetyltransferase [Sulfitobacter albidus]|uniref:GNAT family N-acetyltransferase n=1 Tax=Sulfitobacter albidus TaxID=2829501 RepID=A0A975PL58_9RHOB|nr:GNAT family N-acetyltransferase [Sulfitobacter albidus]QUJ75363.1 GNAT family N-acetyltransferase [Sulfitobacter albidus]